MTGVIELWPKRFTKLFLVKNIEKYYLIKNIKYFN